MQDNNTNPVVTPDPMTSAVDPIVPQQAPVMDPTVQPATVMNTDTTGTTPDAPAMVSGTPEPVVAETTAPVGPEPVTVPEVTTEQPAATTPIV